MENKDYSQREYLSVGEVSSYLGITVDYVHTLIKQGRLFAEKSTSGQYRFNLKDISPLKNTQQETNRNIEHIQTLEVLNTRQTLINGSSIKIPTLLENSVHLAITSPPYFNAKMYSDSLVEDLGNIHDLHEWLEKIGQVWRETYRVLQPGRKFFLNIMNLPIREGISFRTLNLVGKSIDLCESIGFIFKRDIIWEKTNGVRAHFGTYPYPGGILINNMHEFILEFNKPSPKNSTDKYKHLTEAIKESSKIDKEFWLSLKNSDVWLMKPEGSGSNRDHVAPFPLELPHRLIKAYSFIGETVFDPFAGSGTTLVSSAINQRNGIGVDINAKFINLAKARLEELEKNRSLYD